MDGVSITFHVIANSSVRKSDKLQQSKAEPDALGHRLRPRGVVPQHLLFPRLRTRWDFRAGGDTILG